MKFKQKFYNLVAKAGIKVLMSVFPEYFAKEPLAPADRYIEYPFALRNILRPPAKVLDVGSAGTFFPLILSGFGYETYAVDIRPYSITNKIKIENFKFFNESIIKTSFPDNLFDAITAISTVEHIGLSGRYGSVEDVGADRKAVIEMKRVLKTGGCIILTVPFGKEKILRPYSRIYGAQQIKDLTDGLKIEKEEYYMQDVLGDWFQCSKDQASNFNATINIGPLCLLKLKKV